MRVLPFEALPEERIGFLLRRRRYELGLTQNEVAVKVKVNSRKTVENWERENGIPRLSRVPVIAVGLGIPINALLASRKQSLSSRFEVPRGRKAKSAREHGTRKGAAQHYAQGESACTPCREAMNPYQQAMARERGVKPRKPSPVCGEPGGADGHYARGEKPCTACYSARNNELMQQRRQDGIPPLRKLSRADYAQMVQMREQGYSVNAIADKFRIDRGHASRISRGLF
jgi:transcriptional regulator with XRE-family HTH domain